MSTRSRFFALFALSTLAVGAAPVQAHDGQIVAGTLFGAGAGAVLGAAFGGQQGAVVGGVIGAAVGGTAAAHARPYYGYGYRAPVAVYPVVPQPAYPAYPAAYPSYPQAYPVYPAAVVNPDPVVYGAPVYPQPVYYAPRVVYPAHRVVAPPPPPPVYDYRGG
jgi:hypothetical protein